MNCGIYFYNEKINPDNPTVSWNGTPSESDQNPIVTYRASTFCRELLQGYYERLLQKYWDLENRKKLAYHKLAVRIGPYGNEMRVPTDFDIENFTHLVNQLKLFAFTDYTTYEIDPSTLTLTFSFDKYNASKGDIKLPEPPAISAYILLAATGLKNVPANTLPYERENGIIQYMFSPEFLSDTGQIFESKKTDQLLTAFYYYMNHEYTDRFYYPYKTYSNGPGEFLFSNLLNLVTPYRAFVYQFSKEISDFMRINQENVKEGVRIITNSYLAAHDYQTMKSKTETNVVVETEEF